MTTVKQRNEALSQILKGGHLAIAPSAYDALSAMLIERAGFPAVHISGSGTHRSHGFGDVGLLTLTEQVTRATNIADSVGIPVIADAETGHGNAVNVVRAVREFERAGVSGIHIEDQETPKRPTHEGAQAGFIPLSEFVGKIAAAADTRSDPNFTIIARMDARGEPYERMVERGRAAAEAGADALWIGVGREDITRIAKDVPKPMVGIPRRPEMTFQKYEEAGFRVALVPGALAQAACWAMAGALRALKEKGSEAEFFASLDGMDEVGGWFRSIGSASVKDIEGRYMSA
jgi:2,3-dimethylmalate lyase